MDHDYSQFVSWAFQGLLGAAVIYAASTLAKLRDSVDELNLKMATIIEKMSWHEKEIETIKSDITLLKGEFSHGR